MPSFGYWHGTVTARANKEDPYPWQDIRDDLNEFGEKGWELVNMTPNWTGGYGTVGALTGYYGDRNPQDLYAPRPNSWSETEMPFSTPGRVRSWYCTFKRCID